MNDPEPSRPCWSMIWMRCWLIASLMFAGAKLSYLLLSPGFSMPAALPWIGLGSAVVLFLSSVACVTWNGKVALWSLLVSLLSMVLLFWPTLAR